MWPGLFDVILIGARPYSITLKAGPHTILGVQDTPLYVDARNVCSVLHSTPTMLGLETHRTEWLCRHINLPSRFLSAKLNYGFNVRFHQRLTLRCLSSGRYGTLGDPRPSKGRTRFRGSLLTLAMNV